MRQVSQDIFLVEFSEKKHKKSELMDTEKILFQQERYGKHTLEGIEYIPRKFTFPKKIRDFDRKLSVYFEQSQPYLYKILELGKDKINLCMPDMLYIPRLIPFLFELYFTNCSKEEAEQLLRLSLAILSKEYRKYKYTINERYIQVKANKYTNKYIFHRSIFKDKQEMLRNIGPSMFQQGFNLVDGNFTTISGGLSTTLGISILDTNFRDLANNQGSYNFVHLLFHGFYSPMPEKIVLSNCQIIKGEFGAEFISDSKQTNDSDTFYSFQDFIIFIVDKNITRYYIEEVTLSKNVQDWLGKEYIPYIVGIDCDRYVVLNNICKKFGVHSDILQLLCSYWLIAESDLAKERLLYK